MQIGWEFYTEYTVEKFQRDEAHTGHKRRNAHTEKPPF